MIPLSFLIIGGALVAFFWAVNNAQFENLDEPSFLPMEDKIEDEKKEEE